ncbi:family 78 glycoside hydrolase catalytic domain [Haloferula rosea]|uniref:alpha-L-rhamnosidase n=1 Tax=Haloferula rosea TaxID=490093 RepID=A0A934R9V1_9BACT|nr:family 78 glycoside hydrolase catalytic domain [Haloferula rosea]MBK1826585.1 family 78 glycoside hydrolase catalytic domain [Haloferula rosea]
MQTRQYIPLLYSGILFLFASGTASAMNVGIDELKTEYLVNPIQLDTATPRLSWKLRPVDPNARDISQTAYQVLVASSAERLAEDKGDLWDSGRVKSSQSILVPYGGSPLESRQRAFWKVRVWDQDKQPGDWSAPASWEMALLEASDWEGSQWIGHADDTRKSEHSAREQIQEKKKFDAFPSPLLRKEVALDKEVRSARAYVSGVGYFELYINGSKVGENLLDPGQTNYNKHTLYVTHDITKHLTSGTNALGIWLGNGFYGQNLAFNPAFKYGKPSVRAKFVIDYQDGSRVEFATTTDWKTAQSPIIFDNIYWGETYDARIEIPDWSKPGFDDSKWQAAIKQPAPCPDDKLRSQLIPPIQVMDRLDPVKVFPSGEGKYIVDFGKNIAGSVEITVDQQAGDLIKIVPAEVLNKDGKSLNMRTMGGAPGSDHELWYICKGGGPESWSPRFTYTGFQFVEISGLKEPPTKDSIQALMIRSAIRRTGDFSCSDEMLNKQYQASLLTLEDNWHSIPEDCPHREKCGWLGDAHAAADISFYSYDMSRFFTKFMWDIEDSLTKDARVRKFLKNRPGVPPMVSPGKRANRVGNIDWAVAYVIVPWRMYLHTGDLDVFREHYPHIKDFITYYGSFKNKDGIIADGLGDWCPPRWDRKAAPEFMECHPHVSGTAFYYEALQITGKMAREMGDTKYADWCFKEAENINRAFHKTWLKPVKGSKHQHYGSQTATVMALRFGMTPEDQVADRMAALLHDIEELHDGHHSCGIHGLRHFYTVLAENDQEALAYRMLTDTTFPGPAYIMNQGLSTWPERQFEWDKEVYRNSFNHPMQGGFTAFMHESVGGIEPAFEQPGYKRFTLKPHLTSELQWAKTSMESPYGTIRSDWKNSDDQFEWSVEVPPNSKATLYFPYREGRQLMEGDEVIEMGTRSSKEGRQTWLKHEVGSGLYHFTISQS